ncbi:MAG: hypothetical protein WKF87_06655 [Chryseolinea sp.]
MGKQKQDKVNYEVKEEVKEEEVAGDRLENVINALGTNKNAFSVKLGVSAASIYNITSGRNAPGYDILGKIMLNYPIVNMQYLLTGIGDFLRPDSVLSDNVSDLVRKHRILEEMVSTLTERIDRVDGQKKGTEMAAFHESVKSVAKKKVAKKR